MAAINLAFVNAAATRTGNPAITELSDGTPVGDIAGENYNLIVRAALTGYPWRWATKTATLAALTGDPDPPWLYAYQLPTDLLKLRNVTVDGRPIEYERQSDKLLCDVGTDYDVIVKYTWSVPEADWPSTFAEALTQHLEAMFLRGTGERYEQAEARAKDAMRTLSMAKLEDSQGGQSARNPMTSPTLAARNGTVQTASFPWRSTG